MSKLLFHSSVAPALASFRATLPHATLLSGKKGIGLTTAARHITGNIATVQFIQPALLTKASTIPQISVEVIRQLYETTRTKHPGGRVIVIKQADAMTSAAQHTFLKLLEEPNDSTHFVLTSHNPDRLLPTIRSRTQHLHLPPLSPAQTSQLLDTQPGLTPEKKQQLRFIATGLPAELHRLLSDESYFQASSERMRLAKHLLTASPYETIRTVIATPLQRSEALALIAAMIRILEARPNTMSLARLDSLLETYDLVEYGANIKLRLAQAML